ncbi:MAG: hypothetical protein QOD28_1169 [Acidobacteriota bacterium]|nr:hypothetical protein [Acidobacteriota bacterium]
MANMLERKASTQFLLKEILWRPGVGTVLALYGLLQLISNFVAWLLPIEEQAKYQFIRLASWRVWLVGTPILTLALIGLIIRSALRVIAERDAAHEVEATDLKAKIAEKEVAIRTEEEQEEVILGLGGLIIDAHGFLLRCKKENEPLPNQEIAEWKRKAEDFLLTRLGRTYFLEFVVCHERLPDGYISSSTEHRFQYSQIYPRFEMLTDFLRKVKEGSI